MGLEAVMVLADNSEWMRNGDYAPTRLEAQNEAISFIANSKLQQNPESEAGLLSMAGERVQLHTSLCRSMGTIMTSLQESVQFAGKSNFMAGLKIAQLALKNRQNKQQKPRIIMFVGSPFDVEMKVIVKLGKDFRKNNIAVDVVNFGTENTANENTEKLEAFINACNSSDNSHLVNVPPGPHILSDMLCSSPIVSGSAAASAGGSGVAGFAAAGAGGGGFGGAAGGGGMEDDPEFLMAIRMSLEEDRQRQEREGGPATATTTTTTTETPTTTTETPAPVTPATTEAAMEDEEEEDEGDYEYEDMLLQQAMALSLAAAGGDVDDIPVLTPATATATATATTTTATTSATVASAKMEDEGDADDVNAALNDPNFLNDLLASTGVDQDDLELDDILNNLIGGDDEDEGDDK